MATRKPGTDARAALPLHPMDDLMRDAFGPPDLAEELTPDEWAMPSLVPSEMHDDEWSVCPLQTTMSGSWCRAAPLTLGGGSDDRAADLASSMLQLENIQHRLDALQLEIYWYGVAPLGAKTTSEELLEQFSAGGDEYDRHEAARFHRWVENARRAHLRRERSVAQPRVY